MAIKTILKEIKTKLLDMLMELLVITTNFMEAQIKY